jgi:hypothetical protein
MTTGIACANERNEKNIRNEKNVRDQTDMTFLAFLVFLVNVFDISLSLLPGKGGLDEKSYPKSYSIFYQNSTHFYYEEL